MRPIKFRAWDKLTHKIYDVTCIDFYNEVAEIIIEYENKEPDCFSRLLNEIEVMQYTGLKDKNGVEIFEGDIVENTTQTVYLGDKFEVTWNKNYAVYQLMSNGFTSNIPLIQDFMSYEVIGNVHENQELVRVEE